MIKYIRYANLFLVALIIPKLIQLIRSLMNEHNDKEKVNLVRFGLLLLFLGILLYAINCVIVIISMIVEVNISSLMIDINSLITNIILFVSISMFNRIKRK